MRGRMKAGLILGLAGLGVTTSGCEPGREGRAYAAGGEADGQPLTGVEVTFIAEDALRGPLKDASAFDACLGNANPVVQLDCVRNALESTTEICDPEWYEESI